ncbi:MAG: hypothetical protein SFV52_02840 [Saprospiraceae bacterium]|nr:hypothetical protein [Saprospiraceae bacterium]
MKRFLRKLLLFGVLFFLLDKLLIPLRDRSPAPEMEADRRLEYLFTGRLRADLLVTGSSRGARSVIAQMLADSLGMPAYNLAYPGSGLSFHVYVLEQSLRHLNPKPHTVVLVIDDPMELFHDPYLAFRTDRLYPLVKYAPAREGLVRAGEKNAVLSRLLVSHQLTRQYLFPRRIPFTTMDTLLPCGSMPIHRQDPKWNRQYGSVEPPYDPARELEPKRRDLERFVELCRQHNVRLVLAIPPNFNPPTPGFAARMQTLVGAHATVFHYDTHRRQYRDPAFFYDQGHVNAAGARLFTEELAGHLKTILF